MNAIADDRRHMLKGSFTTAMVVDALEQSISQRQLHWEVIQQAALQAKASDIFLIHGELLFRTQNEVVRILTAEQLGCALANQLIRELIPSDYYRQQIYGATGSANFTFTSKSQLRFRANIYRVSPSTHTDFSGIDSDYHLAIALRPLPSTLLTASEINLDLNLIKHIGSLRSGLVMIAGASGTGKSTTLWTLLESINQTRKAHILTLEDPIEYLFTPARSVFSQRQIGEDVSDYIRGAHDALRQAPDVLFIGEIRDYATMKAALNAAESGQLVFTTLHTRRAHSTIARILQMAPAAEEPQLRYLLAHTLQVVICQELPRRADGRGRIALREILLRNPTVTKAILGAKDMEVYNAMLKGQAEGMTVMDRELMRLYHQGDITNEEASLFQNIDGL